jgi:hypothetical protein
MAAEEQPQNDQVIGLCAECQYAAHMKSDRGSIFLRCERALTDKRFAKYPRLPVLACSGYERCHHQQKS